MFGVRFSVFGVRFSDIRDINFSDRSDTYGNLVTMAGERGGEIAWQRNDEPRKMKTIITPTFLVEAFGCRGRSGYCGMVDC